MPDVIHGAADVHEAAKGIFDALPDDPFGEEALEGLAGTEEDEGAPPAEDEDSDEDFDAEGADALDGDEDEAESDYDEGDEGDDVDESEDDDDDEDPAELTPDPTFTVRVDGEDEEVTEAELRAGYSRTASWTRKSQTLSQERKAFETEKHAVAQERQHYGQALQTLGQQLQAEMPQRPATNDPAEWVEYSRKSEQLAEVQSELQATNQRQEADYDARRQQYVADQNEKLVELIPEWVDTTVAMAEKSGLATYAMGLGYSEAQIEGIVDHLDIMLLRKAKAYDDLGDAKKAVKQKAKKARTMKPGQAKRRDPAGRKKSKAARSKRDHLRQTGHVRDAAAYIHDTLLGDIPDDEF
jgi:hypothetical protein